MSAPTIAELNLPCRLDPAGLDWEERCVVAGILSTPPATARETIAALRAGDFTSAALETIVRATDRNLRTGRRHTRAAITQTAVEHGLIRDEHRVAFERLLHDIGDDVIGGELGAAYRFLIILRAALRSLAQIGDRAAQAAAAHAPHEDRIDAAGHAINEAGELAPVLDGIADQLLTTAQRLRDEVVPL
ncbi:hypothetical protein [Pseudactinotalea sp.]|uniref:hypothetical protein n=1 Tax=Pseudactinotalea sp. TaxID=1926260 RepID=UPI003B3A5CC4